MRRLWIQFRKGGRRWYTQVTDADEAYSALEEARMPTLEEIDKGLTVRYVHDYGLEIPATVRFMPDSWQDWKGEDGEVFKEFCDEMDFWVAQEQAEKHEGHDHFPPEDDEDISF